MLIRFVRHDEWDETGLTHFGRKKVVFYSSLHSSDLHAVLEVFAMPFRRKLYEFWLLNRKQ